MQNTSTHVLSTSRKHTTGFLVRSFGRYCGNTVLTAACYWPSSHCIPAQKFVSVSGEFNRNRSPLALDSDSGVCCHHSFSIAYMNLIDSHSRVNNGVTVGSCRINCLLLAEGLVLLASQQGLQHAKSALKYRGIMPLYKPKVVYAASERQYTAVGGDAQEPRGDICEWRKVERGGWYTDCWAETVLRELYRSVVTKRELSNTAKLLVFKSVFVLILTYGNESWVKWLK